MTEPVSAARSARQSLAEGLAALQSPGLPEALLDAAAPIAQAMSQLHRIESTNGSALSDAAPQALVQLRQALGLLQSTMPGHPAADQALEAVARSLSTVHALSEAASAPPRMEAPAVPPRPAVDPALAGTVALSPAPQQASFPPPTQPSPGSGAASPGAPLGATAIHEPQQQYQAPPPHAAPQPYHPAPHHSAAQGPAQQPQHHPQGFNAPAPQYHPPQPPPQAQAQHAQPQHVAPTAVATPVMAAQAPAQPVAQPPAAPGGRPTLRVEAELGAHSSSNFYKGLSSNDIIESGGIFVATYQIPDVGSDVLIKVSMPGGYEFEALGSVAWTREVPLSGMDAPPGFGARFVDISPEGRQLVYRYVRNREPLFHDDF